MIRFVLFWSFSKYNILQVTNTVLVNYVTGQKYITFSSKTKWFYMRKKLKLLNCHTLQLKCTEGVKIQMHFTELTVNSNKN